MMTIRVIATMMISSLMGVMLNAVKFGNAYLREYATDDLSEMGRKGVISVGCWAAEKVNDICRKVERCQWKYL